MFDSYEFTGIKINVIKINFYYNNLGLEIVVQGIKYLLNVVQHN